MGYSQMDGGWFVSGKIHRQKWMISGVTPMTNRKASYVVSYVVCSWIDESHSSKKKIQATVQLDIKAPNSWHQLIEASQAMAGLEKCCDLNMLKINWNTNLYSNFSFESNVLPGPFSKSSNGPWTTKSAFSRPQWDSNRPGQQGEESRFFGVFGVWRPTVDLS